MSTQVRRGRTPDPLWKQRARALPVPLAIVLTLTLLIVGGTYWFSGDEDGAGGKNGGLNGESFAVGYAGSASRLRGMTKQETTEQLRDWARYGLAARLGMGTDGYRDSSYDTLPVRDPAFDGLVRQANGPGRSLFDGDRDTLHVLVPRNDRHKKRTVAMEIDQHRTDAGSDPRQVRVHEYEVRPRAKTVQVAAGQAEPAARVRAAYGYVTGRVDTAGGLKSFLARADRLSSLTQRGSKVYAGGWSWGGKSLVDAEDVAVLQRGYASRRPPGFSLDPKNASKAADIRGALPELKSEWAADIARGKAPAGLRDKAGEALFQGKKHAGLPENRAQLWALYRLLDGGPAYTQARYEGELAGTEVGMTLFYADYVAKHWVTGAGAGVPSKAVGGFVPDTQADTPWSQCSKSLKGEAGRLWFGQSAAGFSYSGDRVDIGAQPTRLFARSSNGDGGEVEPSYQAGRGLRWWDRHYQDVADYEPQYERLDGLMRWSGALDWLHSKGAGAAAALPEPAHGRVNSGLKFRNWYADHRDELRERGHIEFVSPPSADEEALQNGASKAFKDCGRLSIKGGVSLAARVSSGRDVSRPDVPQGLWRAGEFGLAAFDGSDGTGHIEQVSTTDTGAAIDRVKHTFSRGADGSAVVRTEGEARQHEQVGELRVTQAKGPAGEVSSRISAGGGEVRQSVETSGRQLGELRAVRTPDGVGLWWGRGLADRFRSAAQHVQERVLKGKTGKQPVPAADDVLYEYRAGGRAQYKVGGKDAPWFAYTDGDKADDAVLSVRLGVPSQQPGGGPESATAALVPGPGGKGPGAPRGPPGEGWIEAGPPDPGRGRPAMVRPVDEPRGNDSAVTVKTSDGTAATLHYADGRARAKADDPVLGLNGTAAGAALMTHYAQVDAAMRDAERSGDGLYRAVELGPDGADGIALAGAGKKVVLFESDYDWAGKLRQALGVDTSKSGPLIRYQDGGYEQGGEPQHVSKNKLAPGKGQAHTMQLGDVYGENPSAVYASPRLSAQLSDAKGDLPHYSPSRTNLAVVVVPVVVQRSGSGESRNGGPDIYRYGGEEWRRIGPSGGGPPGSGGGGGGNGGSGAGGSGAGPSALTARPRVVIACTAGESEDPDSPSVCHTGDN